MFASEIFAVEVILKKENMNTELKTQILAVFLSGIPPRLKYSGRRLFGVYLTSSRLGGLIVSTQYSGLTGLDLILARSLSCVNLNSKGSKYLCCSNKYYNQCK